MVSGFFMQFKVVRCASEAFFSVFEAAKAVIAIGAQKPANTSCCMTVVNGETIFFAFPDLSFRLSTYCAKVALRQLHTLEFSLCDAIVFYLVKILRIFISATHGGNHVEDRNYVVNSQISWVSVLKSKVSRRLFVFANNPNNFARQSPFSVYVNVAHNTGRSGAYRMPVARYHSGLYSAGVPKGVVPTKSQWSARVVRVKVKQEIANFYHTDTLAACGGGFNT